MSTHRQTLLAKLAPMFGAQTENLAVAALGHILSESGAARRALRDVIAAGGVDVGEIASVRTHQATGEQGERPDLYVAPAGYTWWGTCACLIRGTCDRRRVRPRSERGAKGG